MIIRSLLLIATFAVGATVGYVCARANPDYPSHLVFDQVTREQWQVLGWGTDPTEKPHAAGDFWCKKHIDGNGDHCSSEYRPKP